MMPPIPTLIHLPTDHRDGYYPANVVAAIPLDRGRTYTVTAVNPLSSPYAPTFLVAEVGRSIHGFWFADEWTGPTDLASALARMCDLASALARMCDLAGRPGCPSGI